MQNPGSNIRHPKLRGEWAEMRFMAGAAEHGLCITKPWGDSFHYDFIVECEGHISRVQVKSTQAKQARCAASYICDLGRGGHPYTSKQIDFFAIYVIPCNVWYIFPVEVVVGETSTLTLSPNKADAKHAAYQEAWHLLRGKGSSPYGGANAGPARSEAGARGEERATTEAVGRDEEENGGTPAGSVEANPYGIRWNPIFRSRWSPGG